MSFWIHFESKIVTILVSFLVQKEVQNDAIFGSIFGPKKWLTIAEMPIFGLILVSKMWTKMIHFWLHFEAENESILSSISSWKWIIFGSKMKSFFRSKNHFRVEKEISFWCRKWKSSRKTKLIFELKMSLKMNFRTIFGLKNHFWAGKENSFWVQNEPKIDDFRSNLVQKRPKSAHFEPKSAFFGPFWPIFIEIDRNRPEPARKCWLASLACAFSRVLPNGGA